MVAIRTLKMLFVKEVMDLDWILSINAGYYF
jgi:hypothetical protein